MLVAVPVVPVGSLHPPNHPGCLQVVLEVVWLVVLVTEGGRLAGAVDVVVVVVGSLQPNQPGVLHLVVVVVSEVLVVVATVVVLSRQPHQPGVLQVEVLVLVVEVVDEEVVVLVVVESEPLLLKYFQFGHSKQSFSCKHSGTVSYFSMTSIVVRIL